MMGTPNTTAWWSGKEGDEYLKRNRVDWRKRIPFWREVLDATGARSVYEFGCNAGWNLSAIKRAYPDVAVAGMEINGQAADIAEGVGLRVGTGDEPYDPAPHELTFTAGVLIHIPPPDLHAFMQRVIDTSSQWVLAVEYEAPEEQEIEYRGQSGLLWKRDYGKLYKIMGLTLDRKWDAGEGFDRCTSWLLSRG